MMIHIPNLSFPYVEALHRADERNTLRDAFIPMYNEWHNNQFNHLVEDKMEPLPQDYVGEGCVENYTDWFYYYGRSDRIAEYVPPIIPTPPHHTRTWRQAASKQFHTRTCRALVPCRGDEYFRRCRYAT
ncbi:unnamed protein product [Cuscuta campestris]|uniref:Uncharacterized protein n=1 Tax=Cuscuta campestris TaxID=132261 RepID=A0A484MS49_9ASTE|nr:unnamed protein product [Cuscuta campestris]